MTTARMRWVGLLSAGALTLTLGACAGDDDGAADATSPSVSTQAPAGDDADDGTSETAGSTEDDTSTEADSDAAGEEIAPADFVAMLQEPGKEKLSTYTISMDMKSGSGDMTMEGAVDLSGDQPKADIDMTMPGAGAMKMIMADGRMFMSMPGVTEDGKFMEVPAEALGEAASAVDGVDITSQFDDWEKAAKKVVLVGDEDVDGEQMKHYKVTMDAAAIAASNLGEDAGATAAPSEDVEYDIWLDGDNLLRKIAFEMEGIVTEVLTDNWGEPQKIEAPAEGDLMSGPTG